MTQQFQFTVDHMVGRRELELVVTYNMTPGCPEQGPTYSCGGTPADPPEVEIVSVTHEGRDFPLSDEEEEALLDQAYERAESDWADEAAAAADYAYEQYRDLLMERQWEREA